MVEPYFQDVKSNIQEEEGVKRDMSIRKKENDKTLDRIGKEIYDFNFNSEIIIYKDLCCLHLTAKERKERVKLPEFNLYQDWKNYIVRRYKDTDKAKLIEFSRYLNQLLRNREYSLDYWELVIPVVLTLGMGDACSMLIQNEVVISDMASNVMKIIIILLIVIAFMIFVTFLIFNTMQPTWESYIEKNFLVDIKEIVDELVDFKEKKTING